MRILKINITAEELQAVQAAYKAMVAKLDYNQLCTALTALNPNCTTLLTPALIRRELDNCQRDIMGSWGDLNEDGSLDVDLLDYPSAGCGSMGFILKLEFDKRKDLWLWSLSLDVEGQFIYET